LQQGKVRAKAGRAWLLATLALATAALSGPASASAAVINFDDRSPGEFVNAQYANQGVTFNDLRVRNSPGAHSAPNVAERTCPGFEFCQVPSTARFTAGQDSVRVWVGFGQANQPVTASLIAYGSENGNDEIGRTSAPLPVSGSGDTPTMTPLELNPAQPIRRVEVTTESGFTGGLLIDDFEFSDVGPPPPCNAAGPPIVSIFEPAATNPVVQRDLFRLRGNAFDRGAPITSATLELISPTNKVRQIYPTLIDSDGGNFDVMVGELLEPGVNEIRVTATNCAGQGVSATRQVTHNPVPPGARFQQLGSIEVNQAVQNATNQVRLIAAEGTSFKRTFARVYLGLQGATGIDRVSGTLTAFRPDGSRPDGPLLVDSLNTISVRDTNTLENVRANGTATTSSDLTSSLTFELPREWLEAGRLHLELANVKVEGANLNIPCDRCANPNASGLPDIIRFHEVPPLRVWILRVPYQANATAPVITPAQNDVDMLVSWLERAYPTAEVLDTQMLMPTQDDDPEVRDNAGKIIQEGFTCNDLDNEIADFMATQQTQHAATRYYGMVDDTGGFMRGCAPDFGRYASGPTGCCSWAWDTDGTYGDWYGAHEIAHTFGRKHPGQCTESDDDDSYPYDPDGLIGNADFDYQGIDAGNTALGLPMALYDWRDLWADVMTYCDWQWISNYTYKGILSKLCDIDRNNCPDRDEITRTSRAPLRAKGKRKPTLTLGGELNLASDRLELSTLATGRGGTLTDRPKRSDYEIVLRRSGRDRSYPFEPKEIEDLPAGQELAQIDEVVPFDPRARVIAIEQNGRELAAQKISRSAPSVRLGKVKRKGDEVKVSWRSRDRDGGKRTHSVLYSSDGKQYLPVAAGLKGRSYKVDVSALPGGKKARIRVVANDGVLTGSATSKAFAVPVKAPEVSIVSPAPGQAFDSDDQVQLAAHVRDLQDQQFAAGDIVWRSSIQGELGTGPSLLTRLDAGSHEITATATNSGRKSGSASIRVEVEAVPPLFDAS
jgi:hypothetical protein